MKAIRMNKKTFEQSQDEHRKAQQERIAKSTTPAERLEWLEQTLKFLHKAGIDYIGNKHKIEKGTR
jgi:hypothetical protein